MNKTQKNPSSSGNGTSFSELFQDVFGLEAWAEQKKTPNARRSVPWQWVLWGGLIFFCLGFALSHFSFWVIIVAIAATVIVFLARSTETVEPQVFLLTDERSPEQKHAYKTKSSKTASNRKRPSRRTQSQSTPANLVADNVNEPIETVSKPRRQSRKRASTSKDSNELTPQNSPESRSCLLYTSPSPRDA